MGPLNYPWKAKRAYTKVSQDSCSFGGKEMDSGPDLSLILLLAIGICFCLIAEFSLRGKGFRSTPGPQRYFLGIVATWCVIISNTKLGSDLNLYQQTKEK